MSKEKNEQERKVLSLKELIQNKVKYQRQDGGEIKTLEIERLGADISIETPSKEFLVDVIDMTNDKDKAKQADAYLVYSLVKEPNLKDKELQEAYDCSEPTDVVEKIFTPGEIGGIVEFAFKSAGMEKGGVKVVEEIKN